MNYGVIVNIIQSILSHSSFHLINQTFSFQPHSSSFLSSPMVEKSHIHHPRTSLRNVIKHVTFSINVESKK